MRRHLLITLASAGLAAAAIGACGSSGGDETSSKHRDDPRPERVSPAAAAEHQNIIFIYTDDQNVYDFKPEYNYSNLDARHQFTAHALYSLPWGFEISGIVRTRSGSPMDPRVGSDTNGDSNNNDRPYMAVGQPFLRNSFRNRGVVLNNDIRLLKSFTFGAERYRVQFSAEMFNLLNRDNVVFAGQGNTYGAGINPTTGATVAVDSRFQQLKNSSGGYNSSTTAQSGNPFQAQFGVRFFF